MLRNPTIISNKTNLNLVYNNIFDNILHSKIFSMGLLPDKENCYLSMRRECRERFPRHRPRSKPLVSDHCMMHHGTCVTHVPWCMLGSQTRHSRRTRNLQVNVSGKRPMDKSVNSASHFRWVTQQLVKKMTNSDEFYFHRYQLCELFVSLLKLWNNQ